MRTGRRPEPQRRIRQYAGGCRRLLAKRSEKESAKFRRMRREATPRSQWVCDQRGLAPRTLIRSKGRFRGRHPQKAADSSARGPCSLAGCLRVKGFDEFSDEIGGDGSAILCC